MNLKLYCDKVLSCAHYRGLFWNVKALLHIYPSFILSFVAGCVKIAAFKMNR